MFIALESNALMWKSRPEKVVVAALPDNELLKKYQTSENLEVLGVLYHRYMTRVFGLCFKYLKDEEEAKDAVMQLFEKLAKELLRHEVRDFKPWLFTTARNHCLNLIRQHKKIDGKEYQQLFYDSEEDPFRLHPQQEKELLLEMLNRGMSELPQSQEVCLRLFYLEERSYKEIADITGYDYKKVKSHIQNGKRNLKNFLERRA